jgi:hypothetical protein
MANTSVGQQAASSKRGWQQGGSGVETLLDHRRCCFVVLLGWQLLTDGICDDVLDMVEGIASETVIELTQEEKGIKERYGSDKKMYTFRKNQKDVTHWVIRCAEKHCR